MIINEVRNELGYNSGIIGFIKSDGSIRIMLCTRNTSMVYDECPGISVALNARESKVNTSKTVVVVDVEKKDIRAFVFDKVFLIEFTGDLRDKTVREMALERVKQLRSDAANGKLDVNIINTI